MATLRNSQGQLFDVDDAEVAAAIQSNPDLSPAGAHEIDAYDAAKTRREQFGTTGQQALAVGETAVRTATLGLAPGLEGHEQRDAELREQSPFLSMGAQAVGTVAPALVGAGLAGGAARLAGVGARTAAAAGVAGEGLASGLADEVEQARFERRQVSAGNVLLYGLGAELLGRAVPAIMGRGLRSAAERLGPVGSAAARESLDLVDSTENMLISSERRAQRAAIDTADSLPPGPQRDRFLVDSEGEVIDQAARRGAKALDELRADVGELGDISLKPKRIEKLVPRTAQVHVDWAAQTRKAALDLRDRIRGIGADGKPNGAPIGAELGAMHGKVVRALSKISEEMGDISTYADAKKLFIVADKAKRTTQRLRSSISQGATKATDRAAHDALGGELQTFAHKLRTDLEDTSKWGKAGELQQSINAALHDRYIKGAQVAEPDLGRKVGRAEYETGATPFRYDPAKLRSYLRSDELGRGLTPEHLQNVLQGAEDVLATHQRFGTADASKLERLQRNITQMRKDLGLADEVHASKRRVADKDAAAKADSKADTAASRAKTARDELTGDLALGAVATVAGALGGGMAGAAVVGAGKLMRYWRLTNTLAAAGDAASKSAARGAVRGTARQAAERAAQQLDKLPGALVPAFSTALSRFSEGYPDAQSSYDAKRRAIEAAQGDPVLLARSLASSLGDLPSIDPRLFAELSQRMTLGTDYVFRNLPPQVAISLTHPRGIPLSRQALRDFAILWNSAFLPHTVLEDVETGMVSPKQIAAFRSVHADRYAQLKLDMQHEIANNYADVPTQRKIKWDIVLGLDGAAGKTYSSAMGRAAQRYKDRLAAQRPGKKSSPQGDNTSGVQAAKALVSIGAGVTNAG